MKKLVFVLVFLFSVGVVFAGGKGCDIKKSSVKNVELTGTLDCRDGQSGEDCARVFRVADRQKSVYVVCDKSKADLRSIGENGQANLRIKGKVVRCDDAEGEELMIESAVKI